MDYGNKFQIKDRPSTSKGSKKEDSVKSGQVYQKSELKVIYDKVAKVQDISKKGETSRVREQESEKKVVQSSKKFEQKQEEKEKKIVQSNSKIESSGFIDLPEGIPSQSLVDDNLFNKFKPESELKVEMDATTKSIKEESKKSPNQSYQPTQKHLSSKIQDKKPAESMPNISPIEI